MRADVLRLLFDKTLDSFSIVGYQDSFEEFLHTSAQEIEALQD